MINPFIYLSHEIFQSQLFFFVFFLHEPLAQASHFTPIQNNSTAKNTMMACHLVVMSSGLSYLFFSRIIHHIKNKIPGQPLKTLPLKTAIQLVLVCAPKCHTRNVFLALPMPSYADRRDNKSEWLMQEIKVFWQCSLQYVKFYQFCFLGFFFFLTQSCRGYEILKVCVILIKTVKSKLPCKNWVASKVISQWIVQNLNFW